MLEVCYSISSYSTSSQSTCSTVTVCHKLEFKILRLIAVNYNRGVIELLYNILYTEQKIKKMLGLAS